MAVRTSTNGLRSRFSMRAGTPALDGELAQQPAYQPSRILFADADRIGGHPVPAHLAGPMPVLRIGTSHDDGHQLVFRPGLSAVPAGDVAEGGSRRQAGAGARRLERVAERAAALLGEAGPLLVGWSGGGARRCRQ